MQKNRKAVSGTGAAETKEAYISFNRDECVALAQLGFRERWTYFQLKWLANFKTGVVGVYRKQRVTYASIAELVTAPGKQGRGNGNIDDTQAATFLQKMQNVGLVGAIDRRSNGGLRIELPLSPIDRKARAAAQATKPILPDQTRLAVPILPDEDVPPFDDLSIETETCIDSSPPLSVLALTKLNNNTVDAPTVCKEASTSRAHSAAFPLDLPQASRAARPMTQQAIQNDLGSDWGWTEVVTQEALELYKVWEGAGLTAAILFQAKTMVEVERQSGEGGCADLLRPSDLKETIGKLLPAPAIALPSQADARLRQADPLMTNCPESTTVALGATNEHPRRDYERNHQSNRERHTALAQGMGVGATPIQRELGPDLQRNQSTSDRHARTC